MHTTHSDGNGGISGGKDQLFFLKVSYICKKLNWDFEIIDECSNSPPPPSLSNQTRIIESRLEDQARARAFGGAGAAGAASGGRGRGGGGGPYYYGSAYPAATAAVSYSEYEILQHQKEELEMQNRRLVERISKLKYILKGITVESIQVSVYVPCTCFL